MKEAIPAIEIPEGKSGEEVNLDLLVDSLRIVPLETSADVLLPEYFDIWRGNGFILAMTEREVWQFTIEGKFVRKLAVRGRGPEEYRNRMSWWVDEQKQQFAIADGQGRITGYDLLSGAFLGSRESAYGIITQALMTSGGRLAYIPLQSSRDTVRYEVCQTTPDGDWLCGVAVNPHPGCYKEGKIFLQEVDGQLYYMNDRTDTLYLLRDSVKIPELYLRVPNRYTTIRKMGRIPEIRIASSDFLLVQLLWRKEVEDSPTSRQVYYEDNGLYLVDRKQRQAKTVDLFYTDIFGVRIVPSGYYISGKYCSSRVSVSKLKKIIGRGRKGNIADSARLAGVRHLLEEAGEDANPFIITGRIR